MPRILMILVALCCVLVACAESRSADRDPARRNKDLEKLAEWIDKEQSFSAATRNEAHAAVAQHQEAETAFTEAQFYMELRRIVSLAENGHSNVTNSPIYSRFGLVPVRAYWFTDGLYIVRAAPQYEHLLGARIDAIAGIPLLELETQLMDYHGGSQAHFKRYAALPLMLSPALLHAVGKARNPDSLTLRTSRNGEVVETTLKVDDKSSRVRGAPWRYLNPAPLAGERDWLTVRPAKTEQPLYLADEDDVFRYQLLEDGQLAYIQLRSNFSGGRESAREFAARTEKRLKKDRPRSVVLDNRQNPGGDLGRTAEFALALPSLVKPAGKVYVLTDHATFSAGIYTSFYPKFADRERTVIVGEHVGDFPRFWAETGPAFVLPETGYRIGYSLQMHDVTKGCPDAAVCHMAGTHYGPKFNLAVGSLEPDWPVDTRFEDFKSGRDRLLERVLEAERSAR